MMMRWKLDNNILLRLRINLRPQIQSSRLSPKPSALRKNQVTLLFFLAGIHLKVREFNTQSNEREREREKEGVRETGGEREKDK